MKLKFNPVTKIEFICTASVGLSPESKEMLVR